MSYELSLFPCALFESKNVFQKADKHELAHSRNRVPVVRVPEVRVPEYLYGKYAHCVVAQGGLAVLINSILKEVVNLKRN